MHFLGDRGPALPSDRPETSLPGYPKYLVIGASGFISHYSLVIHGGASPRTLETEEPKLQAPNLKQPKGEDSK